MRYAGALHLKMSRAIEKLVKEISAQHPEYESRDMEIVFLPIAHVKSLPFTIDEADETPVGADAVADVEDMA